MQIENHKEEDPFAHYEELFMKLDPAAAAFRLSSVKWDGKEFYGLITDAVSPLPYPSRCNISYVGAAGEV